MSWYNTGCMMLLCLLEYVNYIKNRLQINMAALLAWLIHSITNARSGGEISEEQREQLHKCKKSGRKKSQDQPSSKTIKTPIQEASEEEIVEETSPKPKTTSVNKDPKGKKLKTRPKSDPNKQQTDITCVPPAQFNKPVEKVPKSEKQQPQKPPKPKKTALEVAQPNVNIDDSSFVTVKDKKNLKKIGKERLNEKTDVKVNNSSNFTSKPKPFANNKSELNKNSQNSKGLKPVEKKPFVKKFIDTVDKSSEYVVVNSSNDKATNADNILEVTNKSSGKPLFLPVRESKKVDASLSYACVVSNKQNNSSELQNNESEETFSKDTNKISINNEEIDGYKGVKQKLEIFEKSAASPRSDLSSDIQGPEISRLHKIILNESLNSNKEETFEHLAITSKRDTTESSLIFQNIENSEKKLAGPGSEFTRSERSEAINVINHITQDSQNSPVKTETDVFKLFDSSHVRSTPNSLNTASGGQDGDLNFISNKFNSIQEFLEKEKLLKQKENRITTRDLNSTIEKGNHLDTYKPEKNPLVLEKTFEIFERHNSDESDIKDSSFQIVETQSKVIESDLHFIEKQLQIEESFLESDKVICKPASGPASVIETSTIIETSPLIEASTIIETYPNLGSSPVVETSTIVTSNTGLTPQVEASTVIESFPLKNVPAVLETSTIIVTSSETNTTPITFETSATIEALPPTETQSILEALTIVETPSQSDTSVDVITSSIVETLPELEPRISSPCKAISSETIQKDTSSLMTIIPIESQAEVSDKRREKRIEMTPNTQVRVLTLNDKENQESVLYRLEKNWVLEFRLGPSLLGRKVNLYCNYPEEKDGKLMEFDRKKYRLLPWYHERCEESDDTALETQIEVKIAGSFHYFFTYEDCESSAPQGSGYFLVDPVLKYGKDEPLPLDCIQCQTVISKGLGSFDAWEGKLRVAKECGYNMIHFTPIQELGASNSAYSLSEQLKLNPLFKRKNGKETTFEDVGNLIAKLRSDWKITSICDIVLNHTANESKWIQEHPEATYNCQNCPYLRPAYLLDAALHQFTIDVSKGLYETKGIPEVTTEEHLNAIHHHLLTSVLAELNIPELFMCDVNKIVAEFLSLARKTSPVPQSHLETRKLELIQDPEYKRLASTVDFDLALELYNIYRSDCFDEESRLKRCSEEFKAAIDSLNAAVIDEVNDCLKEAVDNCIASIRYFRVQHDGPKIREISIRKPLLFRYFTDYGNPATIKEHEEIMYSENGKFLMAHNGWVMNADPLNNFAAPGTQTYIRRQLIAWGDSVKLRYGDKPEDCPFLWNHMKKYVEQTAKIFDGVRLDNCHSTPIPVAEYLLDCARKVRPDLYVVAELFTNSDQTDNIFVNKLGISSLIREAMSAWDSHEEGRLVYRYGGYPVGSFYQPNIRPLVPSIAHALFMDQTHDNPSPVEKRSVFDMLPTTALVNMACCASGSNRGYNELVPHHIHVVDETREYTEWTDDEKEAQNDPRYVTKESGIIAAKKAINDLHYKLGINGFNQVFVDQMDPDVVAVTRHSPVTHQSYILVVFTAFNHPHEDDDKHQRYIRPLRVEGALDEIVFEATMSHTDAKSGGSKYKKAQNFEKHNKYINGYSEYEVEIRQNIQVSESHFFEQVNSGTHNVIQMNFKNFKPGSVAVIKVSLPEDMRDSVQNVRNLIRDFSLKKETELSRIISGMKLADLNRSLYRCDQEERDEGHGFDVYYIPNFAPTVYAGLQGFISLLANIRPNNDLGHPLCSNLRDGDWMIDYVWQRLKLDEGTKGLGQWIEENTKSLKSIPRYLIPCYWDVIITGIYILLLEQSYNLMSNFVKNGSTFVRALSLGSVQCGAYIRSADLPELSPNLAEPKPPKRKNSEGKYVQSCVSLSAGLPHFSVGYMRNWGRDTFIALRGLFILTGRYQEARYHILAYAECLRHGLIPNLLDGGRNPRYNCRDAVWWWLHCIKSYVEEAPNGIEILKDKVSRIYPTDDSLAQQPGLVDQPLHDVIQEALTVHFQGLAFRERNAGRQIDEHMTDKGFNNQIGVHPETGFVFGGNDANCGTWMDKMGSSDKAGNRGKPATPRDGSAVELIGLSKSVITWLDSLHVQGYYPYDGVQRVHKNGNTTKWTFKEWSEKIHKNFEKFFWINTVPVPGEIRPDLVNKRGIYKDCYGASQEWTDYQLRCNFPITMVVAPELFDPQHAWIALKNAEKYLLGPLGMKTLDPDDWAYHGDYDNSDDSNNPKTAHGFNYHQGPEWVWPIGFFLRAKLKFAEKNGQLESTLAETKVVLSKHYVELQTSPWRGLPELTNHDGSYCKDSSRTQAWSMGCVLEVLDDLQKIEKKHLK